MKILECSMSTSQKQINQTAYKIDYYVIPDV